ncbi:hypothetical protein HBA54_21390 [Pelagibius litoralis]|uniref:Uncharacterized protein n=1 Tax=Pelagibius litoralis TaxID=374515 RepID=A0A967KBL2_9PROT|nr:hypothetical protein [Pelagibius litoralis]NIA71157.1 hypothetical protein [Pelagibius litoralis]
MITTKRQTISFPLLASGLAVGILIAGFGFSAAASSAPLHLNAQALTVGQAAVSAGSSLHRAHHKVWRGKGYHRHRPHHQSRRGHHSKKRFHKPRRAHRHFGHKHHGKRHAYAVRRACHDVTKVGYRHGEKALIGGVMCYDGHGRGYIVKGSRYVIRYLYY